MKIVHVMNWYIPDMGYQENHLPAEQKKLGHDVEIVTSDRFPVYRDFKQHGSKFHGNRIMDTGIFNEHDVKIHRLPCHLEVKNGGQVLLKGLKKKLRGLKPDVVQAHGAFTPLTLQTILYSKRLGYKIFVDDHSNKDNLQLNSLSKKFFISIAKISYFFYISRVGYFMPVTYASKQSLKSLLKLRDDKIVLLPLGADANCFNPNFELRKSLRKELGLKDDTILIISSGKFHERKDIDVLIKAFDTLSNDVSNVKLLLVGNGPDAYMEKLKKIAHSLGIEHKVSFHDFAPNKELPRYYNGADIGVWPGNNSITVIEAVSTGLPVVVPSSDLAYLLLFKNKSAKGFEKGNVGDLSKKLCELIENRNMMDKLRINALNIAKKELSWEAIAKKSIKTYETTI